MTVTKQDLTHHLSDSTSLTTRDCAALVSTFFDAIRSTLAAGEDLKLSGFGNFTLHEKRARPGRNPKSGEPVEIAARRVVTFRGSPVLKGRCAGACVLVLTDKKVSSSTIKFHPSVSPELRGLDLLDRRTRLYRE